MTYQEIIKDYNEHFRSARETEDRFFRDELKSFEEALIFAGLAIDSNGRRLTHANRFQYHALAQALEALTLGRERIRSQRNFHDLLDLIYQILSQARVRNLSEMYWYDTAVRIGSNLGLPPKHIYLHAGARAGARALVIKTVEDDGRWRICIDKADLPIELSRIDSSLAPCNYENILCIYRNKFPSSH